MPCIAAIHVYRKTGMYTHTSVSISEICTKKRGPVGRNFVRKFLPKLL